MYSSKLKSESKVIANDFLFDPVRLRLILEILELDRTWRLLGFVSLWLFSDHLKGLLAVQ